MALNETALDDALGAILDRPLAPLLWRPERRGIVSTWWAHVLFAQWVVHQAKPRLVVELGTLDGVSLSAFCSAVQFGGLATRCFGVPGDEVGHYAAKIYEEFRRFHDERFSRFSTLLRGPSVAALESIADNSVDLLHIDRARTYQAVRHHFDSWLPKLSDRAVVLIHEINERREDFGVWRFWREVRERYANFEFVHGHGLGVLAVGPATARAVMDLCRLADADDLASVRDRFATLGERWRRDTEFHDLEHGARQQLAASAAQAGEDQAEAERIRTGMQEQIDRVRAESAISIDAIRRDAESRVGRAIAEMRSANRAASAAERRAEAAAASSAALSARIAAIESSTIWRAAYPLRQLIRRVPNASRIVRQAIRIVWWTVSFQLPRRLRDRMAESDRVRAVASSPFFDRDWYLRKYPDIAASGMDPALHYVRYGGAEHRSPGPNFDANWYATTYSDVAARGLNPLVHYLEHGRAEGRQANQLDTYGQWVNEYDTLDDTDRDAIRAHIAELKWQPLISVVVPVHETPEKYLREMIESVRQQLYPRWELCLADDASTKPHVDRTLREFAAVDTRIKIVRRQTNGNVCAATNSALDLATGEFVALLDHDDLLSERALYEMVVELNAHPDADVLYSDSDKIDDSGRRTVPYFKTDWNPDLMLGHNMVSHLGVYRRSLVESLGRMRPGYEGSQDYDLMLRAAEATPAERIRHVPSMLYHWRREAAIPSFSESSLERCVVAARRAIRSHLERRGTLARVEPAPLAPSFNRVVYALPGERPLVSVIVPTRDRADLLARCADGVLTRTDYEPIELIIVDNDSREPETLKLLSRLKQDARVRIIRHGDGFNYAAMNNRAVREARGEVVVLLNNDVNVLSSVWLEEMVSHALRPEVGAVGAKLLYPDGRVQHAGIVLGVGHGAGHLFHLSSGHELGYFSFLVLNRQASAVTAACMAVRRSIYLEAGGLDEVNLPVAFNDVDFCLRLSERGYAVVWTPYAELQHLESATRGPDQEGERAARLDRDAGYLRMRWGSVIDNDPHYNPNCSLVPPRFEPAFPPRRRKPWAPFENRSTVTSPAESRAEILLAGLDRSARIIEIGPSYNPIAAKAKGWNATTLDHATRSELVDKYRGHPGVDIDQIEEVDFVWTRGALTEAVPAERHGTFDALIASHVIEHTPDLITFLDAAQTLVTASGVVILAVPDKRYCFDYFRPLTTTGDVLEAHAAGRSRHALRTVFNDMAYVVKNGGAGIWGQAPIHESNFDFFHSLEDAAAAFSSACVASDSSYRDMHAWQFIPESFELLLLELARLGHTDWRVERITPPTGCEFYAWLRRGGQRAAAALTSAQLTSRRLALLHATAGHRRGAAELSARRR
jgi:glycosyltransferase involved in cell wall biosynthesis